MKKCISCQEQKEIFEFYKHKGMSDGYLNKCKECSKIDSKKRINELSKDQIWLDKEKQRQREKYHNLKYRGRIIKNREEISLRYKNKYPEKKEARNKSSHLKPKHKGNHLHHWSYNKNHFKDVIEISRLDHYYIHRKTTYDDNLKMYRTLKGVLLDTREKCENFYTLELGIKLY